MSTHKPLFRLSISWCLWNIFVLHQFGVVTKGGCETLIHIIRCTLDLHFDWVVLQLNMVNVFNLVSKGVIFQEFCATCGDIIQLIFFNHAFYAFEFLLFYNHYSCEGNVIIIPFSMGTCQVDPLKRALFTLAHFNAPCSIINHFPSYIFPSIENDIHIIGPPSITSWCVYEHF